MTRHVVLLAALACSCSGLRLPQRSEPMVTDAWHWPCAGQYRVATHVDDPDDFHYAVRRAIGEINAAAGRDLMRYMGRYTWDKLPGITTVRLHQDTDYWVGGHSGGATPAYRVSGRCIDRWQVTVKPVLGMVDAILLHELAHVAGLDHVGDGLMRAAIPIGQRAVLSRQEVDLIRCMSDMYAQGVRTYDMPMVECFRQ